MAAMFTFPGCYFCLDRLAAAFAVVADADADAAVAAPDGQLYHHGLTTSNGGRL